MAEKSSAIDKLAEVYSKIKAIVDYINAAVETTMDYTAVYNSYAASFQRLASDWSKDWEEYGYESAEAYGNSFVERMNASLAGLSGIQVDGAEGLLMETGLKNLGLNIREVTQYASKLASTANSIGLTGEVSLAAAQSFTRLAGDMASLFQVDYGTAAGNLQAGLLGQSEALNQYGINLGEAALQAYAYELGLEKTVDEMTQMESMQLRMLAILDQSKMSWGNLADTINLPSNLMRQFTNNMEETGMVLGQLFIPMLQNILPVVNGVTIAIKQLLINIAGLMGIDLSFGSFEQVDSGYGEHLKEVSGGLNDVAASAKKAKAGLRAFDELKVIHMSDTSTGAVSGGTGGSLDLTNEILDTAKEYEKVWNDAYAAMESRAQEFANKISKFLEPIQTIFEDFMIGDFFKAGQDVSGLVAGIFDFFAEAIDKVDWYGIGQKIGDFLAGIDWIAVLKSVGNLIWQALKAALKLYAGLWDKLPIESTVLGLFGIYKVLKLIADSKIVASIENIFNNFIALYKLYKKIGSLGGTVSSITSKLTGLQKAGIVAITGLLEFKIVSDTFEGLFKKSESLVAGIGKIAIEVGGVGATMYATLGPAGLAIAGVTALIASIKGINDAFEDIQIEKYNNAIYNLFQNPGGTPISEVAQGISDAFTNAVAGFSELNSASQSVNATNENIESVVSEIGRIKRAMELGVLSVEEGTAKLDSLFGELVSLTGQKMGELATYLIGIYGEGGPLSNAYDEIQYSAQEITDTFIRTQYATTDAAQSIYEQMKEVDFRSAEWNSLFEQLIRINYGFGELEQAAYMYHDSLNAIVSEIDYEKIFTPEGINTDELTKIIGSLTQSYEEYDKALAKSEESTKLHLAEMVNNAVTPEDQELLQKLLDDVPTQYGNMRADAQEQLSYLTNDLEEYMLNQIPAVMEEARKSYENMGIGEWLWYGITGGNEDKYMQEWLENYRNAIQEANKIIAESGIDGAGWSKNATEAVIDTIIDTMNSPANIGQIIDGYQQLAKDGIDGYVNAWKETGDIEAATAAAAQVGLDALANEQDSHSPSKEYEKLGKDAVDGYINGIIGEESIQKTCDAITMYMDSIKDKFLYLGSVFMEIGSQAMNGLLNGISSVENSLYEKAKGIADNIANTVKSALDIHSPSKVMFQLGDFTMEGLENGLENRYQPILSSIKGFSADLQVAPMTSIAGMYQDCQQCTYVPRYESMANYQDTHGQSYAETNGLLRELLTAVRQGQKIEVNGREIGRTAVEYIQSEEQRLQTSLVGTY